MEHDAAKDIAAIPIGMAAVPQVRRNAEIELEL
jgi:hypothetical protein